MTASRPLVPLEPAREPQGFQQERLLVIDPLTRRLGDYQIRELPLLFRDHDVLVVNDAATLPASLRVDEDLELRLVAERADGTFLAVALGRGDFHVTTEERGTPRALSEGERLRFGRDLSAHVIGKDPRGERLVALRFDATGAALYAALYRYGRPIQYSYLAQPLALWDIQNRYASRPWAFELASAGRPLTFEALFELEQRGVSVTQITHAAGISSTGSPELDRRFPLSERYEISETAVGAVARARSQSGRVVAVGTSVVRALEGNADAEGRLTMGEGETDLRLSQHHDLRVVDGLLTGLHEPGTSHFELLEAFAPRALLLRAVEHAARTGYLQHEHGDSCLILAGSLIDQLAA